MRGYRNPLVGMMAERADPEALKREGWQRNRILVVALDDVRLDGFQREFVKQIGECLYGRGAAAGLEGKRGRGKKGRGAGQRQPSRTGQQEGGAGF